MNLLAHHVPTTGICAWCNKWLSTTSHALFFCNKVRGWWREFTFWKELKKGEGSDIQNVGQRLMFKLSREEFAQWLMGMWIIWKMLCDERHNNKQQVFGSLRALVDSYIDAFEKARQQAALALKILPPEGECKWRKPRQGWFRLDVDYAEVSGGNRAGVGAIVRDACGGVVFALAKQISRPATVLMGELTAVLIGICQCIEEELVPVEVFTDSLLAVHIVAEEDEAKSQLCQALFETISTAKKYCISAVRHVKREANMAAHTLASYAKEQSNVVVWKENLPRWLTNVLACDSDV